MTNHSIPDLLLYVTNVKIILSTTLVMDTGHKHFVIFKLSFGQFLEGFSENLAGFLKTEHTDISVYLKTISFCLLSHLVNNLLLIYTLACLVFLEVSILPLKAN